MVNNLNVYQIGNWLNKQWYILYCTAIEKNEAFYVLMGKKPQDIVNCGGGGGGGDKVQNCVYSGLRFVCLLACV